MPAARSRATKTRPMSPPPGSRARVYPIPNVVWSWSHGRSGTACSARERMPPNADQRPTFPKTYVTWQRSRHRCPERLAARRHGDLETVILTHLLVLLFRECEIFAGVDGGFVVPSAGVHCGDGCGDAGDGYPGARSGRVQCRVPAVADEAGIQRNAAVAVGNLHDTTTSCHATPFVSFRHKRGRVVESNLRATRPLSRQDRGCRGT